MIGKIILTRIEPCFTANKPACGEVSRVKKDVDTKPVQQVPQLPKDTFTSSKTVEDSKHTSNDKTQKKTIQTGN